LVQKKLEILPYLNINSLTAFFGRGKTIAACIGYSAFNHQQSRFKVKTDVGESLSFKKSLWQL